MHTDRDYRHWHVLGAGAIGTLLAHRLADKGCRVTLLSRDTAATRKTLTLESEADLSQRIFPLSPCAAPAPIDQLLVTTKAADVDPAIAGISHRLHADSTVLVLANGMGFAEHLPRGLQAFRGSTTEGAFRRSARHTVYAGHGTIRIGLPGCSLSPPEWFACSWARLRDCQWDTDVDTTLWRKLAINCVINPLTAAYRCHNGELATPAYRGLLLALCDEITSVYRAMGHSAVVVSLLEDVLQIIESTASNRSSMLQDVLQKRQTEIDFINGFLLAEPAASTLELPLNRRLIRAIKEGRQLHATAG